MQREIIKSEHLSQGHFRKIFRIGKLAPVKNPFVIISGTAGAPELENAKEYVTQTRFGAVRYKVGTLNGVDTVTINRHHSTGKFRSPDSAPYSAHALLVAALNPRAIVTLHALGADKGRLSRRVHLPTGHKLGQLSIIRDLVPGTASVKPLFTPSIQTEIGKHYDVPLIIHSGLPKSRIQGPTLTAHAKRTATLLGMKFAAPITVQTHKGPDFESAAQVRAGIQLGADAFSMTHHPEVAALASALKASGCKSEILSLGLNTNLPEGLGKVKHEDVARVSSTSGPLIRKFLGMFALRLA